MSYRWWPERWTTARLMVWLAIGSAVFGGWIFWRDHVSSDGAWVSHHVRELSDASSPRERMHALEVLGDLKRASISQPRVVDALIAAGRSDPDLGIRVAAIKILGRSDLAIDALALASRSDPEARVRVAAIEVLSNSDDPAAVGPIRLGLADPSAEVLAEAMTAIVYSRPFESLVKQDPAEAGELAAIARRSLAAPEPPVRSAALRLLTALPEVGAGPLGRAESLAMFERDPDRVNREQALRGLVHGWPDRSLYPILIGRLKALDDPGERESIARELPRLPTPSAETLATLVEMMDGDVKLASTVAPHLERLGRESSRPYLPALARAARREAEEESWPLDASFALLKLDPDSAEADAVIDALRKREPTSEWQITLDAAIRVRDRALNAGPSRAIVPATSP